MPKRTAAHQKKVDKAVWILKTTTGVNVPQAMAMILAGFPKKEIANETVHRMIRCHLEAFKAKQMTRCLVAPTIEEVLSPLTGEDKDDLTSASATTKTTTTTGPRPTQPKPKRKQIWATASAVQQRHINDLAGKRHKSNAHNAAMRLFNAGKLKLDDGMLIRLVNDTILVKYETCPSIATISCYAKQGLINASLT